MIIASCGHEITTITGYPIKIKKHDEFDYDTGQRIKVEEYLCVCEKCYKWYKRKKLIIK